MAAKTILVVEDQLDISNCIELALRFEGYPVLLARDTVGVRQHMQESNGQLALVLADSSVQDASEAVREVRRTHRNLPIIVLVDSPAPPVVSEVSQSCGASLLSKPFTHLQLSAVVREALERLPATAPDATPKPVARCGTAGSLPEGAPTKEPCAGTGYSLVVTGENQKWPALERLLAADSGISVLKCPGAPKEISSFCQKLSPCVVILDSSLVGSLPPDWIRGLTQSGSVQVLAHFRERPPDDSEVQHCLRLGCMGVLEPAVSATVLKKAVLAVLSGEFWASRKITSRMLRRSLGEHARQITEREAEILRLVAEGRKNSEIADRLFISVQTVRWHLRTAYSKLGITGRREVALQAAKLARVAAFEVTTEAPCGADTGNLSRLDKRSCPWPRTQTAVSHG